MISAPGRLHHAESYFLEHTPRDDFARTRSRGEELATRAESSIRFRREPLSLVSFHFFAHDVGLIAEDTSLFVLR